MRQQFHSSLFRKQKSIDLNDKPVNDSKKILRKQLSVDHVTSGLKHASQTSAPTNFSNLLWRNSTQSLNSEPNLRIVPTSAVSSQTKRAQFAASSISALSKWVPHVGNSIKSSKLLAWIGKSFHTRAWNLKYRVRDNVCFTRVAFCLIYCRCYSANCTFIFLFHFLFIHKNSVAGVKCVRLASGKNCWLIASIKAWREWNPQKRESTSTSSSLRMFLTMCSVMPKELITTRWVQVKIRAWAQLLTCEVNLN